MNTMKQVSVGGRHIQYILENVLRQTILREDKGHPLKQDDKKEYKLADGIITTNGSPYIEIRFYQDYILTVTDNLFTFPIHTRVSEKHIMKVLTDKQQEEILIYCGFTPFRILNAQWQQLPSLIYAPFSGVLIEKRCKKTYQRRRKVL